MAAFLELVSQRKVNFEQMITHIFPIENAIKAYELITGKREEKYLAILLEYEKDVKESSSAEFSSHVYIEERPRSTTPGRNPLNVGFIGAGNFAQSYLLPVLKSIKGVELQGVATAKGINAHSVARKFGFTFSTSNNSEILLNPNIHCIFIATRHNLHANLVIQTLEQNKHVFVEKPLALSEEELSDIVKVYKNSSGELMVGFNRRFSPLIKEVKQFLSPLQSPLIIHYRINAGFIPKTHWTQDAGEGGGRILGEVCHFVDLIQYLTDSIPLKIYAESISSKNNSITQNDNVNITLKLSDGSLGVITYASLGETSFGKERIEIITNGSSVIIDDFRQALLFKSGRRKMVRSIGKGHNEEVEAFINAMRRGDTSPIPLSSLIATTKTTFNIITSLNRGEPIYMNYSECI